MHRAGLRSLVVFRHGQTDYNRRGLIQGSINTPLNAEGMAEARVLAQRLRLFPIKAIVTSPLLRAKKTAEIVQEALRVPLYYDERLVECNCGVYEGKPKDLDFFRKWESPDHPDLRPESGERNRDVFERAIRGMAEFLTEHPDYDCVAVSTHGGVIRRLINFLGTKPSDEHIPNAFLLRLSYDEALKAFSLVDECDQPRRAER